MPFVTLQGHLKNLSGQSELEYDQLAIRVSF